LGLGITIAVGYAISNKDRDVYVMLSDGEIAEGSVWESLKFIYENDIDNIHLYVNINGYSAISDVNVTYIKKTLKAFCPDIKLRYTDVEQFPFLKGVEAHYHVMSDENYEQALEMLEEQGGNV
jgi:transketolase